MTAGYPSKARKNTQQKVVLVYLTFPVIDTCVNSLE
jgi:hypothetical protein